MKIAIVALPLALIGCARTTAIHTSADTITVQTSAAPICGATGAAKVAQRQAAIETIKAGYDRYIIIGAEAANNVTITQTPGTFQTSGNVTGFGTYNQQTTYVPGPMIAHGTHDQAFGVKMFKDGDPNGAQALSAREMLGPQWAKWVKDGASTCLD